MDENEDLIERMNDLMEENESLRKQLGGGQPGNSVRISLPGSHRNSGKSTPNYRDDSEDPKPGNRSNTSAPRSRTAEVAAPQLIDTSSSEFEEGAASHPPAPRKSSAASSRKSTGSVVGFETTDQVVSVPVSGSLRSSRSRVATPFLSGDTVNKLVGKASPSSPQPDEHPQVNFEPSVHVVEVLANAGDDAEPGHHNRSVRGRIATPFIRDVPPKDLNGGEEAHSPEPNPHPVADDLDTN